MKECLVRKENCLAAYYALTPSRIADVRYLQIRYDVMSPCLRYFAWSIEMITCHCFMIHLHSDTPFLFALPRRRRPNRHPSGTHT